ncbi:uncharacterized protein LOC131206454 [Anopheles bellator]|uniref:uncharacterized protein LOC131206454 n=1 Tax=Anopheles bellator TaxID=139047 RepID=UPI0026489FB6|nr:uncharacterized protein LOC131206454 [Anopheles bellator]
MALCVPVLLLGGLLLTCPGANSWDLRSVGIDKFHVRHVSLYRNRAFLTIESAASNVSLVEASWPENLPGYNHRARVLSDDGDESCQALQRVLCTDVDRLARLWVLSGPDGHCPPKLLIRSLLGPQAGEIQHRFQRSDRHFQTVVVDPVPAADGDTRAFITLHDHDYILLYSLFKRSLGMLKFEKNDLSALHPISLSEVTVNHNRLYVADTVSDRLFALPVRNLRQMAFPEDGIHRIVMKTSITYLGQLLGRPHGLKLDCRDNLLYVLPRDGAIVLWSAGRALKAENHRVVFQQSGHIAQIILGVAGKAWAVSADFVSPATRRHCVKLVL